MVLRNAFVGKGKLVVMQVCDHCHGFVMNEQEIDCLVGCEVDLVVIFV